MNTTTRTDDEVLTDTAEGMSYLNRLPRRIVVLYLPMAVSSSYCSSRSTGWRSRR